MFLGDKELTKLCSSWDCSRVDRTNILKRWNKATYY